MYYSILTDSDVFSRMKKMCLIVSNVHLHFCAKKRLVYSDLGSIFNNKKNCADIVFLNKYLKSALYNNAILKVFL